MVYTQNSSGNFNSGSHIFSENYLLQEPEISHRIVSTKAEFRTHFVALTNTIYIYIYIYIYNIIFTSGKQHLRTPRRDQLLAYILYIVLTECRTA